MSSRRSRSLPVTAATVPCSPMENTDITTNDPPSASSSIPPPAPPQTQQSQPFQTESSPDTAVFQDLHSYPFDTDEEFKIGLAVILGHPDTPPTEEELTRNDDLALQARCFYYSRKKGINPPIDFSTYKAWLSSQPVSSPESQPTTSTSTSIARDSASTAATTTSASSSAPTSTTAEPAYPSSFAHIVELITTGQPVPGIQQIPDTVLTGKEAPSTAAKRRKPWEKEDDSIGADKDDGQNVEK